MNAGELKKILERLADNTPILLPSSDHAYREVRIDFTVAVLDMDTRSWSENFEYEEHSNSPSLSRRNVIVIS